MSLSRIVKKPGNVVFNEIVQIKDKDLIQKINSEIKDETNYDLSNQIILDAQDQAKQILDDAHNQIRLMKLQFEEECRNIFNQVKDEAYMIGFEEGKNAYKQDTFKHIEVIGQELIQLQENNINLLQNQLNESQNKTYQIGLEVANKILRHEIDQDHTILKHMILDEIDSRKNQNIRIVEISEKAESLIFDLKNELELKGIMLQLTDDDIDHIVLESESGNYDLSISTQLKNIRRLFNTL